MRVIVGYTSTFPLMISIWSVSIDFILFSYPMKPYSKDVGDAVETDWHCADRQSVAKVFKHRFDNCTAQKQTNYCCQITED
ncbi:MAG: hypothetical protein J5I52_03210 [Saprospiraceae bacterium]|nr:hypothetical protein [Saprospiraceae bacterium]MCZ2337901.1 hypothetical protein [Chitinophagales bacterium]